MRMLLPGIPADDETNRAHAQRLGRDPITCPPPPGSVPGQCETCGGAMWLDPGSRDIRDIRDVLTADGNPPTIVCLLCAFHPTAAPPGPGQPAPAPGRVKAALTRLLGDSGSAHRTGPQHPPDRCRTPVTKPARALGHDHDDGSPTTTPRR